MNTSKRVLILLLLLLLLLTACQTTTVTDATETTQAQTTEAETESAVTSSADMPKGIVEAADWKENYPAVVSTFEKNEEMVRTTYGGSEPYDYLEAYPYLKTFYEGFVFEVQYDRARGHVYALEDVVNTARPKKGASCLACKVSEFNEMVKEDASLHAANFDEFVDEHITVGFTCFDCHGETPGVVNTNRLHLHEALEYTDAEITLTDRQTSCAQCHVEYYMTPDENATTLPWKDGLGCDEAYKYYEEIGFHDWVHPGTGAKLLKAQHPETETFDGSVHQNMGADCTTCHMPRTEVEGETIRSHHWTTPLLSAETSCLPCHSDQTAESIVARAEGIQKPVVEKTGEIALQLEEMIGKLTTAVSENALEDEELAELQAIHREAQFYWDYVFVENGEGFHNQQKQLGYLDHAQKLIETGLAKLN